MPPSPTDNDGPDFRSFDKATEAEFSRILEEPQGQATSTPSHPSVVDPTLIREVQDRKSLATLKGYTSARVMRNLLALVYGFAFGGGLVAVFLLVRFVASKAKEEECSPTL